MITFEGDNKIIQVDNGVTELFFNNDVYIPWKNWVLAGNTQYEQAIKKLGGEVLVPNNLLMPVAYLMLNGWKIRPSEEQQILKIHSNLFTDDGTLPYVIPVGFEDLIIVDIEQGVCNDSCDSGTIPPGSGTNGECGLTPDQDQKLDLIANQMDEVWRLMGLDITAPVNITPNSRDTRNIDQDFTGDAQGNVTITRN